MSADTYFVDGIEVDKAEYVRVERVCGFRNGLGEPDEPATSLFAGRDESGKWHEGRLGYMNTAILLARSRWPDLAAFQVGGEATVLTPPAGTDVRPGDRLVVYAVIQGRAGWQHRVDHGAWDQRHGRDVVMAGPAPGDGPGLIWYFDPEALEPL